VPLTVFRQIRRNDSGCVIYLNSSMESGECAMVDPLLDIDFVVAEARKVDFDG